MKITVQITASILRSVPQVFIIYILSKLKSVTDNGSAFVAETGAFSECIAAIRASHSADGRLNRSRSRSRGRGRGRNLNSFGFGFFALGSNKLTETEYLAALDDMAVAALADGCTSTNPRTPSKEEIVEIFKKIW